MVNTLNAKYGLKRVINASGRMSILGVSAPSNNVMLACTVVGDTPTATETEILSAMAGTIEDIKR
ncbi:hypothetical protein [Oceanobacillus picturae]|uniref:hypothetical protein n=1 Tax=Oceanobacillus picturae TaxID=171693 RepID=UPI00362F96DD